MTRQQEAELQTKLLANPDDNNESMTINKPQDISRMTEIKENIDRFLLGDEPFIEINGLNAYLRKYLFSELKKYHSIFPESIKTEGSREVTMRLHRVDVTAAQRMKEEKATKRLAEFNEKIGFRRVFTLLEQAKKPLVVHSGLYDLAFFIDAFHCELPEKYDDFKTLVHTLFPDVYDTRYILERHPGLWEELDQSSSLKGLGQFYTFLCRGQFTKMTLALGFEKYIDEIYAHEAGFDALMCGTSLLWLSEKVGSIQSYRNLLPLFKNFFAMNLENEDLIFPEKFWYFKGADVKKTIGSVEGFSWRFIKDDECLVQSLSEEKIQEFSQRAQTNSWVFMTVQDYFNSKLSEK